MRLAAQATGEFTKKQLNDDAKFRWTKAAREKIDAIINPNGTNSGTSNEPSGNASSNPSTGGGASGSGNTGGDNTGGGDNGGGGGNGDPDED